jgi:FkbM family methyltransferase
MKALEDYDKIVFLGGGVMAERLYNQLNNMEERLIGVMDLLEPEKRVIKEFKNHEIVSPSFFEKEIKSGEVAVVVAIGSFLVPLIVDEYLKKYQYGEENLFVANPYTSLRFFCVDDELSAEVRIPKTDERYNVLRTFFQDECSVKIYNQLMNSKTYESKEDSYEMIPYNQIKELYYLTEDYWLTYEFPVMEKNSIATVLDCGAYNGDSILPICKKIPQNEIYYYAFEPLKENADMIKENPLYNKECALLTVLEYGVGGKNQKLFFKLPDNGDKEGGKFIEGQGSDNDEILEIRKLDSLNLDIKGTLYIKMDIEGAELEALKGAEQLIKRNRPYLAICLYHRKNDLLEIPMYLHELMPEYKFYLRGGYHTILWAIPQDDGSVVA